MFESSLGSPQVPHPQAQVPPITALDPVLAASASELAPIDELHARAEAALNVFDDPRYAPLDVPNWARRAAANGGFKHRFSVRNLVRAMRDTAADLGLADGARYVLAAVCACAEEAERTHPLEAEGAREALARGLQRLANAWTAFLLWPFYAPMKDSANSATGFASPCLGLLCTPGAMAMADINPAAGSRVGAWLYPLQEKIMRRDGYKCVMSGVWDAWFWRNQSGQGVAPEGSHAWTHAVRIFKHPLVVYKDVYDNDEPRRNSTLLSLELLRRFSQLSDRYLADPMGAGAGRVGVMDDPANLLTLSIMSHNKFDHFALCLVPTQIPDTYEVKDHDPRATGLPFPDSRLPSTITFRDQSGVFAGAGLGLVDEDDAGPCALPSAELLRTHAAQRGVLFGCGVVPLFDRILCFSFGPEREDEVGGLPLPTPDGVAFWRDVVRSSGDGGEGGDEGEDGLDRLVRDFAAIRIV